MAADQTTSGANPYRERRFREQGGGSYSFYLSESDQENESLLLTAYPHYTRPAVVRDFLPGVLARDGADGTVTIRMTQEAMEALRSWAKSKATGLAKRSREVVKSAALSPLKARPDVGFGRGRSSASDQIDRASLVLTGMLHRLVRQFMLRRGLQRGGVAQAYLSSLGDAVAPLNSRTYLIEVDAQGARELLNAIRESSDPHPLVIIIGDAIADALGEPTWREAAVAMFAPDTDPEGGLS